MTPEELRAVIAGGETFSVEFKRAVEDKELVEAVVCLANGAGGTLLLGVDDDGAILGSEPRHGHLTEPQRVATLIANRTTPPVSAAVECIDLPEGTVTVVDVPQPSGVVATIDGRYVRRAIDVHGAPQCLPMHPHETIARATELGARDLSTMLLPAVQLADLDPVELQRYRDLARSQGDPQFAELSDSDLLAALGFATVDGQLALGAVLLFGKPSTLEQRAPTHETAFHVLDQMAVTANRIERRPLIRSMIDLAAAIEPCNPAEEVDGRPDPIGIPRYADVAVREALGNALIHRDYAVNGQVRVTIEDGTLAITNPGGLPEGITTQNLLVAPPQPRNPRIADAFKRVGLVERVGRGVSRVFRSQLALGLPQPDYSRSTRTWVEVRLRSGPADRELAAFVAHAERQGQGMALQTLLVLHEARAERRITTGRAADVLQISVSEARAVLTDLVERGYLESRGERTGRTYHTSAAVPRQLGGPDGHVRARRFDPIQQQQMVSTFVQQHGSISRSQAADLCQLSPDQASRLLRAMARAGALRMTGSRRTARYEH